MPGWIDRVRGALPGSSGGRGGFAADAYAGLRSMVLTVDPLTIQTPADEPWSGAVVAMMELAMSNGTASIVAIADGTVSMYTSTGGGVLGAGGHHAVRVAADRFRRTAADAADRLVRGSEFPLPAPGEVRFHVRTTDANYSAGASQAEVSSGRHPLAELYAAGQDLITEIRFATPT